MIYYDNEDKNDDVIYEEEVDYVGLRQNIRGSRPVGRLEPHWDKDRSYVQLRKNRKVTFEDDLTNIKTEMNHNLLTQTIENIKNMSKQ